MLPRFCGGHNSIRNYGGVLVMLALGGYVGEMTRIKNSIKLACKLIDAVQSKRATKNKKKSP